jgi:NAD(P)-dependent dehydrogenase (short-subunit alcohol dehydrogenase family)
MSERRVVITGAASGIGLATAAAFLERGDRLVLAGRTLSKLEQARASLSETFGSDGALRCVLACVDVADHDAVKGLFDEPADVVVANAGVCKQARLDDEDSDDVWHTTMATNLNGVYFVLKEAARNMPSGGSIITVSSNLGKNARAGYEAYTASKHAVLGLSKCVALELADRGIRVNAVCPGWVNTPMARGDAAVTAASLGVPVDDFKRQAVAGIPMGRMVEANEVASLIRWLASSEASAITGQSYNVACGEFFN